jgi:hypothetical protein
MGRQLIHKGSYVTVACRSHFYNILSKLTVSSMRKQQTSQWSSRRLRACKRRESGEQRLQAHSQTRQDRTLHLGDIPCNHMTSSHDFLAITLHSNCTQASNSVLLSIEPTQPTKSLTMGQPSVLEGCQRDPCR